MDKGLGVWRGCWGGEKGMRGDGWETGGRDDGWESAGDNWMAGCVYECEFGGGGLLGGKGGGAVVCECVHAFICISVCMCLRTCILSSVSELVCVCALPACS